MKKEFSALENLNYSNKIISTFQADRIAAFFIRNDPIIDEIDEIKLESFTGFTLHHSNGNELFPKTLFAFLLFYPELCESYVSRIKYLPLFSTLFLNQQALYFPQTSLKIEIYLKQKWIKSEKKDEWLLPHSSCKVPKRLIYIQKRKIFSPPATQFYFPHRFRSFYDSFGGIRKIRFLKIENLKKRPELVHLDILTSTEQEEKVVLEKVAFENIASKEKNSQGFYDALITFNLQEYQDQIARVFPEEWTVAQKNPYTLSKLKSFFLNEAQHDKGYYIRLDSKELSKTMMTKFETMHLQSISHNQYLMINFC